jgi:hypothetical protein
MVPGMEFFKKTTKFCKYWKAKGFLLQNKKSVTPHGVTAYQVPPCRTGTSTQCLRIGRVV